MDCVEDGINAPSKRSPRLWHPTLAEEKTMADEKKRVSIERDSVSENESKKDVSNDSLGTVDPADSTGLESDEPTTEDRFSKETGNRRGNG
jgi:hypothetical protein